MNFNPDLNIQRITLVGAGGTGAQIARQVARILYDMKLRNMATPELTIVDPDIVEAHNIGRQLFSPGDIGANKAEVVARRFNLALGLNIIAAAEHFNAKKHISYNALLISAVDNASARQEIKNANLLTIDCGNALTTGQVCVGQLHDDAIKHRSFETIRDGDFTKLPSAYVVFPDLLDDDTINEPDRSDLSCAQLVARSEQHLLINDLMSITAAGYVYKLLHRQPLEHWISFVGMDSGITIRGIEPTYESVAHYARLPLPQRKKRKVTRIAA
jgi:PRTRC genetic system ThiF family protein